MISGATGPGGWLWLLWLPTTASATCFQRWSSADFFRWRLVFELGKFIRIVYPVMLGFVNGLVVILLGKHGLKPSVTRNHGLGDRLWLMLGLVAITMAIILSSTSDKWCLLPGGHPSGVGVAYVVNSTGAEVDNLALLTVGDMMYSGTVASAVQDAETKERSNVVGQFGSFAEGLTAVFLEDARPLLWMG